VIILHAAVAMPLSPPKELNRISEGKIILENDSPVKTS
jgi:hypothetical protein